MSRVRLFTVTACLLFTAVQAWGQGNLLGGQEPGMPKGIVLTPGVYPTKWVVPPPADWFSPRTQVNMSGFGEMLEKPASYKALPKFESKSPIYGKLRFFSSQGSGSEIGFVLDESKGNGTGYDAIYLDVDGSGDLSKVQKCVGKRLSMMGAPPGMEFRDAAVLPMSRMAAGSSNKNSAALDLAVMSDEKGKAAYVMCVVRGCLMGEVGTSVGKIPFRLIDNGNQRYNDSTSMLGKGYQMGDSVSFDWGGSGEGFSSIYDSGNFVLSGASNVGGNLYTFRSDAEGTKLEVAKYEGPTGHVGMKYVKMGSVNKASISATIAGKDSLFSIPVGDKPILVPVGDYKVLDVDLNYDDMSKGHWSVNCGPSKIVSLSEGKTLDIPVGGELSMTVAPTSKVVTASRGEKLSVPFSFTSATGLPVSRIMAMPRVDRGSPNFNSGPSVQLKNAAEKVVLSGKAGFG